MKKIKINDYVKVVDRGKCYTSYEDMARKSGSYRSWNAKGNEKCVDKIINWDNMIFQVIYTNDDYKIAMICYYENGTKRCVLMGYDGIEKVPCKKDDLIKTKRMKEYGHIIWENDFDRSFKKGKTFLTFSVGCRMDKHSGGRHSCGGRCEDGYGWYYQIEDIEFEDDDEVSEIREEKEVNKTDEKIEDLTKVIEKLTDEISRKERMQDLLNEAIIEKGKEIAVEDLKEKLKEDLDKFIEEKYGILPKKIELIKDDKKTEVFGIFHKDFEKICKIVNANIPLMLVGSAGAGKNFTLEQVSTALGLDFYFSNAVNQEYKLTGFIDANGKYHETEFYKAFVNGGMFFLDEIDASCPECLVILNSAIANKYFDFPTGRIKAHEDFRVVCAGNTYGTGADMVYVGRNVLDGATLDRFVVVEFDYDEQVERQLAYDEELYLFISKLRKAINEANLRYIVSMRALINATKLLRIGVDKKEILKTTIIKNMQKDDINTIVKKIDMNSEWVRELRGFADVRN